MERSIFINGLECFSVTEEELGKSYLVGRDCGMLEVSRCDFIKELKKYEDMCLSSWNKELKKEYEDMENYIK